MSVTRCFFCAFHGSCRCIMCTHACPRTTSRERRAFVRFEVTTNTGPSARRETAARYEQLEDVLKDEHTMPDAALVFVSAGSSSKWTMPYEPNPSVDVAALAFYEETHGLSEQLSKHRGEYALRACVAQ